MLLLLTSTLMVVMPQATAETTGNVCAGEVVTWSGDVTLSGDLVVEEGGILIIEAGSRVMFEEGTTLKVHGTLVAVGTSELPILLKGQLEEEGGSEVGRMVYTISSPSSRLEMTSTSTDDTLLENCQIVSLAIVIRFASPTISHCTMTENSRLDIDGPCSPTVQNCTFSDNGVGDPREPWYRAPYSHGEWGFIAAPTLVCSSGASPLIKGNTFSRNGGFGIDVMSASPAIEDNTFSGNRQGGVRIDQAFTGYEPMPVLSGNTFRDHGLPDLLANPPGERVFDLPVGAVPAVHVDDADALFIGNLFEGNEVGVSVMMNFSGEPVFQGDVFRDNVVGVWSYKGSPEFYDCTFTNVHFDFWITAYSHVKAHNTTFDENKLYIERESRIDVDGRSYLSAAGGIGILGLLALLFFGGTETGKVKLFTLLFPLFSRMKGEEVLDQFTRGQVYGLIRGNPGIHYSEIKRVLLIGNGTLAHHLSVLEREGFIKSERKGINKLFYPARLGAKYQELEERFPTGEEVGEGIHLSALQEDIIDLVSSDPGITQAEVVARLDVPKQTVSYNVGNLSSYGLLTVTRDGNATRLFLEENDLSTG